MRRWIEREGLGFGESESDVSMEGAAKTAQHSLYHKMAIMCEISLFSLTLIESWYKVRLTEDEAMHGNKNRIMIGTHCSHAHTTS